MATKQETGLPTRLERARERFERWRKTRTRRRIPEALWAQAVQLSGEYGVHRTARALRLNDDKLRHRVRSAPAPGPRSPGKASGFWELVRSEPLDTAVHGVPECIVELEDACGTKLRVHWKGGRLPDASVLRRTFWSGA